MDTPSAAEQTLDIEALGKMAEKLGETANDISEAVERVIAKIVANPIEDIQGIAEEDKRHLSEQQVEVLSLLERAIITLISTDAQFTSISQQIEGWLKSHNNLVQHLNSTLFNRDYLLKIIDGRVKEIDEMRQREHATVVLKDKLSLVGIFEQKPDLEIGQYLTYMVYPDDAEKYTIEDIEKMSYNVVKVRTPDSEELVHINRNDSPELFAAVCLKFSEDYVNAVAAGQCVPTNIRDKEGQEYTMLKHVGVYELQGVSTEVIDPL